MGFMVVGWKRLEGGGANRRVSACNCHMRLTVPGIPLSILNNSSASTALRNVEQAKERLIDFIKSGNITVLTGAGVSVDSGIRAYRGRDGRYLNPNYK